MKADVKRVVGKYRVLKQSIQVKNSRIEEEVQRSLAKALSSATVNKSFVKRTSPYQASRSFQSINLNHGGSLASFQGPPPTIGKNVLADITQAVLDQASFRRESPRAERDRYDQHSNNSSFVVMTQSQWHRAEPDRGEVPRTQSPKQKTGKFGCYPRNGSSDSSDDTYQTPVLNE